MSTSAELDGKPLRITLEINLIDLNKNDINVKYSAFGQTRNNTQFLHALLSGIDELMLMYKNFCVKETSGERGPAYQIHKYGGKP